MAFWISLDTFLYSPRIRKSRNVQCWVILPTRPPSRTHADIAWQILHHQFWSILADRVFSFPIDGFYVYHPSQKSINGDRFRDTSCRFCSHERREGKFSISSRWYGPSNRQTNPRSVQHCWVCLPEESWNLTRKGALASVSELANLMCRIKIRSWSTRQQPGGGGVLPYIRYIGMCRHKGYGFLSRFGLKTGIDLEHFGLKLGMVIGGTFTKAYKLIFLPSNRAK